MHFRGSLEWNRLEIQKRGSPEATSPSRPVVNMSPRTVDPCHSAPLMLTIALSFAYKRAPTAVGRIEQREIILLNEEIFCAALLPDPLNPEDLDLAQQVHLCPPIR